MTYERVQVGNRIPYANSTHITTLYYRTVHKLCLLPKGGGGVWIMLTITGKEGEGGQANVGND